jgi:hypothetical protein
MYLASAIVLLDLIKSKSNEYAEAFKDTKIEYGDGFYYNMVTNTIGIRGENEIGFIDAHRDEFTLDYVNKHYGAEFCIEDYDDFAFLHECGHAFEWLITTDKDKYHREHIVKRDMISRAIKNFNSELDTQSKFIDDIYHKINNIYNKKLYRFFKILYDNKIDKLSEKLDEHLDIYYNALDTIDWYYRGFDDESFADRFACENYEYIMDMMIRRENE